jgi:hypothetical protein
MEDDIPLPIDSIIQQLVGGGLTLEKSKTLQIQVYNQMKLYGWSLAFIKNLLKRFDQKMLNGRTIQDFIEDLAKALVNKMNFQYEQKTLLEIYMTIGLTQSTALQLSKVCNELWLDSCYTHKQVIEIGIEYLVGKFEILTDVETKHYYSNALNKWFNVEIGNQTYSCINVPYRCTVSSIKKLKTLSYPSHNSKTHDLHFHTTSWANSLSIMDELNHAKGRPCLDFGITSGFYISQIIDMAVEWGYKTSNLHEQEIAILVFSIPKYISSPPTLKHLEGDEWKYITKQARLCKHKQELPEIARYDLIFGNMVANPKDIERFNADPVVHTPPKTQLVSKRRNGDIFLQTHLLGCIYFQKYMLKHR